MANAVTITDRPGSHILIDTHYVDCGLRVECSAGVVKIWEWASLSEPDENGSLRPHIRHTSMRLKDCLRERSSGYVHPSQRERVMAGATAYLSRYSGEEHPVDEGDSPCDHFGTFSDEGPPGPCSTCGLPRSTDCGDAPAFPPC